MIQRRLVLLALACVALGLGGTVVVPWAILEQHVRRVASDPGALLEALEAPEGSWEWEAAETYARRPEGEEALRRELAFFLCELWARQRHFLSLPRRRSGADERPFDRLLGNVEHEWFVAGFGEAGLYMADPDSASIRGNEYILREITRTPGLYGSPFFTRDLRAATRLAALVTPSSEPIAKTEQRALYFFALGDPRIPSEVLEKSVLSPEMRVVFVASRGRGVPSDGAVTGSR